MNHNWTVNKIPKVPLKSSVWVCKNEFEHWSLIIEDVEYQFDCFIVVNLLTDIRVFNLEVIALC